MVPVAFCQMMLEKSEGVVPVSVRFWMLALVANRLVEVESVNTAVEGLSEPMAVLSMVPPLMVTLGEMRFWMVAFVANRLVPDAVLKPNQSVEVPLVKLRLVMVPFVTVPLVKLPLVAKRLVELASVKMAVLGVVLPMGVSLMVPPLMVRLLATFSSCNVPVMEPKSPKDRVTAPLPSVPELTALALTLPVLSMVRLFETMASVTELLGKVRLPVTARLVVLVLVPVALVYAKLVPKMLRQVAVAEPRSNELSALGPMLPATSRLKSLGLSVPMPTCPSGESSIVSLPLTLKTIVPVALWDKNVIPLELVPTSISNLLGKKSLPGPVTNNPPLVTPLFKIMAAAASASVEVFTMSSPAVPLLLLVTKMLPLTLKSAFDVPPLNSMLLVVTLPTSVICCSVDVGAGAGQFVPFCRQTLEPFTAMEDANMEVPEAVAKPSQLVEVASVKTPVDGVAEPMVVLSMVPPEMVAFEEIKLLAVRLAVYKLVPEAVAKPSQLVEVALVNTPVEGVLAPIAVLLIVPPLMVNASDTLASESVPVMEPNEPKARVTPALPKVPELMAEALMLPEESMVRPFTTMASVTELLGKVRLPVTTRLVEVELVNTPVEGVVAPMAMPLMEPPERVALEEDKVDAVRLEMLALAAFTVVPEAVVKPNQLEEVPLVKFKLVIVPLVIVPVVMLPLVAKRLVEVELVEVVLVNTPVEGVVAPMDELLIVPPLMVALEELNVGTVRFVMLPFVAKRLVEVELVDVTLASVTLPSVDWPVTFKVPVAVRLRVLMPPYAETRMLVDAPLAVMVCKVAVVAGTPGQFVPFCRQTLEPFTAMEDANMEVPDAVVKPSQPVDVPLVKERLVEPRVVMLPPVAVKLVAKRLVEVVLVPVALVQMTLEKLEGDEPVSERLAMVALVAYSLVEVELVNTPVEGVAAPMAMPLMEPPERVALEEIRVGAVSEEMVALAAFTVVPDAVLKPNHEVEVPLVKVRLETVPLVMVPLVKVP